MNSTVSCDCCDGQVRWVRHTQFSGNYFFCIGHAKLEPDFGTSDSYHDWEEVNWSVPKKFQPSSHGALKPM